MQLQEYLNEEQLAAFSSAAKKADKAVILYSAGLDKNQIAVVLDSTPHSVGSMLSRARSAGGYTRPVQENNPGMELEIDIPPVPARSAGSAPAPVVINDVDINTQRLGDMDFPPATKYTAGNAFDRLWSEDGGIYSGTINICTGESGVGKTTVLIDYVTDLGIDDEDKLYVSSEMTRNDLQFYMAKQPKLQSLRTLVISDHMRDGSVSGALKTAFTTDRCKVIVLDSFQDCVEKVKDIHDWTAKQAENFIINLMVEAAEDHGKTVIAIQHMNKSGQYVGRTYLKHATTAMMEVRFDKTGGRNILFSKNRRNGSMVHKPLPYTLSDGDCHYDGRTLDMLIRAERDASAESERNQEALETFKNLFDIKDDDIESADEPAGDDENINNNFNLN